MVLSVIYVAGAAAWWVVLGYGVALQGGMKASAERPPRMTEDVWMAYMLASGFLWPILLLLVLAVFALHALSAIDIEDGK